MEAAYVFSVQFRLRPAGEEWVEPDTFETRLFSPADPPGEPGWLFFRDNLWRGDVGDAAHFRDLVDDRFPVRVESVAFRAFETDEEYLDALKAEIRETLPEFKADSVREVLSKYFGSAIEVR